MSGLGVADYTVIAVAVLLASCLQASIGFGMGMLAAPVVALIDPSLIPGTLIMLATLVTLLVVIRERTAIDVRGTGWALVGRVPGTIAGALLLAAIPERALAILIACVVLVGVAVTSVGWIPVLRRRNLMLAGATSGVLGTATSIGGPPMALIWQRSSGAELRGTMSGFFLIGSVMSIAMLALTGAVDSETFRAFAFLIPATIGGYALSRWANRLLTAPRQRWTAIVVSAVGATALIVREVGVL
ncbi:MULTISPECIES: sulfite exporter TauE/SafE family protein [unclassified Mycobacterium]|uniref:sulfite exporter TauE/SafE family protein n=1 Tax=unclassified Mycobacterium TaxID=2642494 RepID=UPI0029C84B36|nr:MULTISPECIES: sulfite exporter TauE/SafE family protein [unclassified Mycobacterium]